MLYILHTLCSTLSIVTHTLSVIILYKYNRKYNAETIHTTVLEILELNLREFYITARRWISDKQQVEQGGWLSQTQHTLQLNNE
jgi:hypothetical protein